MEQSKLRFSRKPILWGNYQGIGLTSFGTILESVCWQCFVYIGDVKLLHWCTKFGYIDHDVHFSLIKIVRLYNVMTNFHPEKTFIHKFFIHKVFHREKCSSIKFFIQNKKSSITFFTQKKLSSIKKIIQINVHSEKFSSIKRVTMDTR